MTTAGTSLMPIMLYCKSLYMMVENLGINVNDGAIMHAG